MKPNRRLALGLVLLSWFAFCQGCASDTPSDSYRTSYRISLADIPERVPLDSMRIEVRIDGVLDTSISVPQAALLDRNFSYTVESVSGALIDIDYVVYSGMTAVAQGHDHYDPRVAAPDTVALARDTAVIRVILDGISYSKALSIAFAGRSDTLTETTIGNLSLASLTGFSAARGMQLTQRHTLVLWDDLNLYEIVANTGALVRQRAHGLVSIQDMVYQPQGSATPEP